MKISKMILELIKYYLKGYRDIEYYVNEEIPPCLFYLDTYEYKSNREKFKSVLVKP